jgi:hypothetical protein
MDMKWGLYLAFPLVLMLCVIAAGANINGEWTDPSVNSRAVITQSGNMVDITNSFMWKGKMVEWKARGELRGRALNLKYWYTQNKPAGWEPGTMELRLTDSKTLSGRWVSETRKYQQIITLKYIGPEGSGKDAAAGQGR